MMRAKTYLLSTVIMAACSVRVLGASVPVEYPANPGQGFSWPYYLYVPAVADTNAVLVVEPNNTGSPTNDFSVHDTSASNLITERIVFAADLHSPYLMPVFPEPASNSLQAADSPEPATNAWVYTQALSRDCFLMTDPTLQRLDLQLAAMIADARTRLAAQGVSTDPKVFMVGFSASAMFANRFTALHPGMVKAAATGAPGGWPLAPVTNWQTQTLRYPVGISDVVTLTGTNFNLPAYISVPQYIFLGDQDTNDSVANYYNPNFFGSFEQPDSVQVNQLFGTNTQQRWPVAQTIYAAAGCTNARFVTYPGIAHNFTDKMRFDIERFFEPSRQFLKRGIHAGLSVALNSTNVSVNWATLSGLTYYVQSSSNLANWYSEGATNFLGDGFYQSYQTVQSNRPAKFYRLVSEYVQPGSGRGFFFYPTYGSGSFALDCATFSVTCSNLYSGTCQTTIGGPGTFTYSESPPQATLNVTFTKNGQSAILNLTMSNTNSGVFQGVSVKSGVTNNIFGGSYETVTAP
jgi:pimeloyl-ACP methyl ester carboxylesterase